MRKKFIKLKYLNEKYLIILYKTYISFSQSKNK